ncbi:response regulator [Amycolatopsis sp. NPDC004747]
MTTVLICDDRRSVREGLTRVMSAVPGVSRIDCVAHGDELLARYSRQPVDVVLVGTQRAVPTGVEATRRLVSANPQANVIVFGAPDDAGSIAAAIAGGARGYLRWDASRPELVAALAHTLASTSVPAPRHPAPPADLVPAAGPRSLNRQPCPRVRRTTRIFAAPAAAARPGAPRAPVRWEPTVR